MVLWDVDHTLIENGGISKLNYVHAFESLARRPAETQPHTDGRTDPEIMANLFLAHGIDDVDRYRPRFAEALADAMHRNRDLLRDRGCPLPGALAALQALATEPDVVQSVLTGNIPANAREKLAAFGLDGFMDFGVGGFGTDSSRRAELVPAAQRRAATRYGHEFDMESTVLVGDTVRDVRAALDGGAKVIAVATGEDSMETLERGGADAVLPNLRSTEDFLAALARVRSDTTSSRRR